MQNKKNTWLANGLTKNKKKVELLFQGDYNSPPMYIAIEDFQEYRRGYFKELSLGEYLIKTPIEIAKERMKNDS